MSDNKTEDIGKLCVSLSDISRGTIINLLRFCILYDYISVMFLYSDFSKWEFGGEPNSK